MAALGIFSVRDLRKRTGELLRGAQEGRLAVVTERGRPAMLAVPFDDRLLGLGVHRALALRLSEDVVAIVLPLPRCENRAEECRLVALRRQSSSPPRLQMPLPLAAM